MVELNRFQPGLFRFEIPSPMPPFLWFKDLASAFNKSTPAENALSPEPVKITALTFLSSRRLWNNVAISFIMSLSWRNVWISNACGSQSQNNEMKDQQKKTHSLSYRYLNTMDQQHATDRVSSISTLSMVKAFCAVGRFSVTMWIAPSASVVWVICDMATGALATLHPKRLSHIRHMQYSQCQYPNKAHSAAWATCCMLRVLQCDGESTQLGKLFGISCRCSVVGISSSFPSGLTWDLWCNFMRHDMWWGHLGQLPPRPPNILCTLSLINILQNNRAHLRWNHDSCTPTLSQYGGKPCNLSDEGKHPSIPSCTAMMLPSMLSSKHPNHKVLQYHFQHQSTKGIIQYSKPMEYPSYPFQMWSPRISQQPPPPNLRIPNTKGGRKSYDFQHFQDFSCHV